MHFLKHIAVIFLLLCLCGSIIVIINIVLDKSFLTPKPTSPLVHNEVNLYPKPFPLLDLWNFQYIINNEECSSNNNITTALIITSYAGDVEGRSAIRNAYPKEELRKLGLSRVFLLALLKTDKKDDKSKSVSQRDIITENERFGDLVQGNFYEAYRNLTYKHVMGLQWAVRYCNKVQFIIKMDDDIIVDFYRLMHLVKSRTTDKNENLLMGYVLRGLQPIRDSDNKWFVTKSEYYKSFYPPFLSGWMYVTTPKVAETLVKASTNIRFFWIDDTYITGILARATKIKLTDISNIFTVHPEFLECCLDNVSAIKLMCDYIVGPSGGDYDLLIRFQKYVSTCYENNCPKRDQKRALNKTCVSKQKPPSMGRGISKIVPYKLF